MPWILILIGVFLMVIGGYFKYQQFKPEYSNLSLTRDNLEDEYIKQSNKLKKINNELDQLIKSIDIKEKIITEKLNNIINFQSTVEKPVSNLDTNNEEKKLFQINSDFKKVFDRHYHETKEQKNNEKESIIKNFDDRINSKYNSVFSLASQGMDVEDIAKKLNFGVRETSLILKLYRKEEDSVV